MPQEYIVIFLLFLAVLAFAWFYLQRAKARPTTDGASKTAAAAPAESTAAEHADHAEHGDHSH
jgi:Flp pilus assembly protein TadG